jgi:hypothetical protein
MCLPTPDSSAKTPRIAALRTFTCRVAIDDVIKVDDGSHLEALRPTHSEKSWGAVEQVEIQHPAM